MVVKMMKLMKNQIADVVNVFGADLEDKALERMILSKDENSSLALKELLGRNTKNSLKIVQNVLEEWDTDRRLKAIAVNYLGNKQSDDHIVLLRKALERTEHPSLKRQIVKALGAVGSLDVLEDLKRVEITETGFATSLIAYRHQKDGYLLPTVAPKKFSKRYKHIAVETTAFSQDESAGLIKQLEGLGGDSSLYSVPALRFKCVNDSFWMNFSKAVANPKIAEQLLKAPAIPMQIFKEWHCPLGVSTAYYLMTHPKPKTSNELQVNLVSPTGKILYTGTASVEKGAIKFLVGTAEKAIFPPVRIEGIFSIKKQVLELTEAFSQLEIREDFRKHPTSMAWNYTPKYPTSKNK